MAETPTADSQKNRALKCCDCEQYGKSCSAVMSAEISHGKSNNWKCCRKGNIASTARRLLHQHVPIVSWIPAYSKTDAISDVIAGITIGLTLMPQSIAYASLANLPPQYGLYSAFIGGFIYAVFGTVKEISIGPTAIMSLITFQFTQDLNVDFVVLLCFLGGCIELLLGVLRLGFLIEFISIPVSSGFASAGALIVAGSQLKGLLGLKYKASGFMDNISKLFQNIGDTRLGDSVLGVLCIVVLLLLRRLKDVPDPVQKHGKNVTRKQILLKKSLWFISIGRNALVVFVCTFIASWLEKSWQEVPFYLSGQIEPGLPPFQIPAFSTHLGNSSLSFLEMCQHLGSGIVVVPLVSILANVAIAKAFASGESVDATQEMIALGLCNIFGACVGSMPTCGAFSRSAVNNASGVRTPLGGIYSGTVILLVLSLLSPYFYFIPRATLAAVIICAAIFMVEYQMIVPLWNSTKHDLVIALVTFFVCLCFGVEVGLLAGIVSNACYLLYLWARPSVTVERSETSSGIEYLMVSPDIGLFFPAMDYLRSKVGKVGVKEGRGSVPVVINCKNFKGVDFSAIKGIGSLLKDFNNRQQLLLFLGLKPNLIPLFSKAGVNGLKHCNCMEDLDDLLSDMNKDKGQNSNQRKLSMEESGKLEQEETLLEVHSSS